MSMLGEEMECSLKKTFQIVYCFDIAGGKKEPQLVLPEKKQSCINNLEICTWDVIKNKFTYGMKRT